MATGSHFSITRIDGVATAVLCRILDDAYAEGCASVVINADPAGMAVRLYRPLGFVDQVYWWRGYRFEPS